MFQTNYNKVNRRESGMNNIPVLRERINPEICPILKFTLSCRNGEDSISPDVFFSHNKSLKFED